MYNHTTNGCYAILAKNDIEFDLHFNEYVCIDFYLIFFGHEKLSFLTLKNG